MLTSHKVAIKILNRKKIKQMDMEEKGALPVDTGTFWCRRCERGHSSQLACSALGGRGHGTLSTTPSSVLADTACHLQLLLVLPSVIT